MRDLKYRQAIFKDGKFHHWHYWGYVGHNQSFVAPIEISQQSWNKTYEVKDSQEYFGMRSGLLGLGPAIYEGDIVELTMYEGAKKRGQVTYNPEYASFEFASLLFDIGWESVEVIGSIYENPELLEDKT